MFKFYSILLEIILSFVVFIIILIVFICIVFGGYLSVQEIKEKNRENNKQC